MTEIHWIKEENEIIKRIIGSYPNKTSWIESDITDEMYNAINSVAKTVRSIRAIRNKIDKTLQQMEFTNWNVPPTLEEKNEAIAINGRDKGAIMAYCIKYKRPRYQVDNWRTHARNPEKYGGKKKDVSAITPATASAITPATEPVRVKRKYTKRVQRQDVVVATKGKIYDDLKSPKKNYLQALHYGRITFAPGELIGEMTTLLGPPVSWMKIYNFLRQLSPNKIISFENNPLVAIEQMKRSGELKNVGLCFDDVDSAKSTQFMDIDFMQNLPTIKNTLVKLFAEQKKLDLGNKKKVFMFSFSLEARRHLDEITIPTIEDVLFSITGRIMKVNRFIEFEEHVIRDGVRISLLKKMKEYFVVPCDEYEVIIYYYCDGTPMLNISIQYR